MFFIGRSYFALEGTVSTILMKRHLSLQQQYIHKQNGAEMVEKYQKENIWYDSLTPMKFLSIISIHYPANW